MFEMLEGDQGAMNETLLLPPSVNVTTEVPSSWVGNGTDYYHLEEDELYEVPVSIVILLSLLYGAISVTALIGNILVLWVVTVSRRMRTVTNMFIANLAFADIIIGLFAIPFQFQAALLQRWNLPDFMCAFCPFVQVLSVNVSVFTLSAIALDRYRAVLYPLSARVSKRKASFVIVAIWTIGVILAFPMELDFNVIEKQDKKGSVKPFCENTRLSETFRRYYFASIPVLQYFLPLVIISGAYARMAKQLWFATAPGNKEESRDAVVLRNKKKVIKMLLIVVLLFALCWLPFQLYNFFQTFIPAINEYQYINIIWFSFHWLAMSNSCCNPFIYAMFNDKFQREFRSRFHCLRICRGNRSDSPNSELSDFDRSRIRASYRFTDGRNARSSGAHGGHRSQSQRVHAGRSSSSTRGSPHSHNCSTKGRINGVNSPANLTPSTSNLLQVPKPYPTTKNNGADFDDRDEIDLITNLTTL